MIIDFEITSKRYLAKKIARRAAVSAGRMLLAIRPVRSPSVRVLMYHRFGGSILDPCSMDIPMFRSNLAHLSENKRVITPHAFAEVISGKKKLSDDKVLITIDDGHVSVSSHALPILDQLGMQAILFVCPGLIERQSVGSSSRDRHFMTWDELNAARKAGHEIAPHGLTHRSLGHIPLSEALDDIEQSTLLLDRRLGVKTPFFSFPFGTRQDFSEALLQGLWQRGYQFCFSAMHGACTPSPLTRCYPRLKIEGGPEGDLFPHILRGCLDYWGLVDSHLHHFQQRGRL